MKSQIAQTSRGPIEYVQQGNGPVVLVCHGTSSDCFSAGALSPLVEAGFSLLAPSRPGYGRTPSEVGVDNFQAAEALIALLDELKIQTCSVVAISGGGPTGIALAAKHPQRIKCLALLDAITWTENRQNEPAFQSQKTFYGPMHAVMWGMLRLISTLSPRGMARQTMVLFSQHDPVDALAHLSAEDIEAIVRFYHGRSSRRGALNDFSHEVSEDLLQRVPVPTLVVHSREDASVPFTHAEWSMKHIPHAQLCEGGMTGHFFWVGPDFQRISQQLICFLRDAPAGH